MPSKNLVAYMLEAFELSVGLEGRVLRDLHLTRESLPKKDFSIAYNEVDGWIKRYRIKHPKKSQQPYLPPKRPIKKSIPPKPDISERFSGEPIDPKVREITQEGDLLSRYKGPGKIYATEETLLKLIVEYGLTMDLDKAAKAAGIFKTTAKKYLRGYGFNLPTRRAT